jgi:hypothetical protein
LLYGAEVSIKPLFMKLTFRYPALVLLFVSGMLACKKSSDDKTRNPNKLRISKIELTLASLGKGKNVTEFIYDDQQRVNNIVFSWVEPNASPETTVLNIVTYYYNGTDKKPYKASGKVSSAYWMGEIFYTYNNSGILIRDSAISNGKADVITRDYTYSPGKIIVKRGTYTVTGGVVAGNTETDSFAINNNNITEAVYESAAVGLQNKIYYQCTYDNNINPLSKLNIASVKIVDGIHGFPDNTGPGLCKNNMAEYVTGLLSLQGEYKKQFEQKYSFTYTNEGLPETCVVKNVNDIRTFKNAYEEI